MKRPTCTVAMPRFINSLSSTQAYDGAELRAYSVRPGALAAFALPSRTGACLHYRTGRIEMLEPAPVPALNGKVPVKGALWSAMECTT